MLTIRYLIWPLLIILVIFRYLATQPVYKDGQRVRISARVSQEPMRYQSSQKISFAHLSFFLPGVYEVNYGDYLVVEGRVKNGLLEDAKLVSLTEGQGVFELREKIIKFFQSSLPEPHASLVSGVVVGSKASLPKDFWEELKKTGTLHVVVASGMNVTMVANFLFGIILLFFKRRWAIPVAIAGVWVYTVFSGFDAPIARAALMGSLAFGVQELGRLASAWKIFFLSCLIMLIIVPSWVTDLGFVLSFVATASLMLFEKRTKMLFSFLPSFFRQGLTTSLAAQIGVSPILFVTFGQFNLASPLINALILWTVPYIMVIGALGAGIGLLLPGLGKLTLYLAYPLTWWFTNIVTIFNIVNW